MIARVAVVIFVLALTACGKPSVSGRVLPEITNRAGLPWHDVEIRLLRGNLAEQLQSIAVKYRGELADEARQRVLESAKGDEAASTEALHHLGAAGSPRACLATAEADLAAARRRYDSLLSQLAPRIAALGVTTDSPASAIEQLRGLMQTKLENEARRLRDEYLRTQLQQQSGVVLATGRAMDRLCWSVQNKHDLAVQFRGPIVLYNGHPLPDPVASRIWGLPALEKPLRIPSGNRFDSDILLPGASFETCFYARGGLLPRDLLDNYGLSTDNPTRSGEWRVQWQTIDFVRSTDGENPSANNHDAPPKPIPLQKVFADRIRQFQAESEEAKLIELLSSSQGTQAVRQAEGALLACHRAIEQEKIYQDTTRVIQAIEEKRTGEFAVEVRVRPMLTQLARDPAHLSKRVDETVSMLDRLTVSRQQHAAGEAFQFTGVDPGRYTLVARSTNEQMKPKVWLIPLDVSERGTTQDLIAATSRNATLRSTLETMLQGS
ncbi:MAG TPA: hypothetical protein VMW17_10585 [Candidatus Binatia bacterium]|nr:hypothetical protein [Candidatus Binatia bacterium]